MAPIGRDAALFSEFRPHHQTHATVVACVAVFLTVAASLALAGPASAATIDVNTTADELNGDGDCALREAVRAADLNLAVDACTAGQASADTVEVDAGTYTLAIPGGGEDAAATGDLDLTRGGPVTVAGAGARATTVDGADLDRVFDVREQATAEITRLTITNGDAPLVFRGVMMSEPGGGVFNLFGALTLRAVAITDNTTSVPPGMPFGSGFGGGVGTISGTTKVFDSVISGNRVPTGSAASVGGGVGQSGGSAEIANTTVSRNAVVGNSGNGGGIAALDEGGATSVKLTNATVTSNAATAPPRTTPSGEIRAGGNLLTLSFATNNPGATITTRNSIVANPVAGINCSTVLLGSPFGTAGPITSSGGNLEFPGTSCGFTRPSDNQGQDPRLGPLADNGGPTNTHALRPGSPAIDAATNTACPARDQRGVQRPTDGDGNGSRVCDMGAFEREGRGPSPGPECTVRGTAGNDIIRGTPASDVICGGYGNDIVYGGGGNDTIRGGAGNDIMRGEAGNDQLSGGDGNDILRGGGGADRLNGGPGRDILSGQEGNDDLDTRDNRSGNDVANGGPDHNSCRTDPRDSRSSC